MLDTNRFQLAVKPEEAEGGREEEMLLLHPGFTQEQTILVWPLAAEKEPDDDELRRERRATMRQLRALPLQSAREEPDLESGARG